MGGTFTHIMAFSWAAAERRGAEVHHVLWPPDPPVSDAGPWVVEQVAPRLAELDRPLLIAKSLGTHAAPLAAEHDLPAVWLTPLLGSRWVVDGLRRATAPFLLVGGTADPAWDADLARELSPHVCEVDGADHAPLRPGPLARSAEALGEMATAVERFLDEVIWR